jgi:hypothetical protein
MLWRKRKRGVNGSPDVAAAGPAVAAVDRGGGVLALAGGQAFGFGQCVGQLAADVVELGPQLGALRLEGGDEPGPAFPPGSLPLSGASAFPLVSLQLRNERALISLSLRTRLLW